MTLSDLVEAIEELETIKKERDDFLGALQWCSASQDFQVGGYARKGWLKLCAPLIARTPYSSEGDSTPDYAVVGDPMGSGPPPG